MKVKDEVYNGIEYQTVAWFIQEGCYILGSSDSLKASIIHHHQLIFTGCPLGAEQCRGLFVSLDMPDKVAGTLRRRDLVRKAQLYNQRQVSKYLMLLSCVQNVQN